MRHVWLIVLVLVVGLGGAGCASLDNFTPWNNVPSSPPVPVELAVAVEDALHTSPAVQVSEKEDRIVIIFQGDMTFAPGAVGVKPAAEMDLLKIAGVLRKYPRTKATIAGHTDNVGPKAYNQVLSERRARAARQVLLDAQVEMRRLNTVGYGEVAPIDTNKTNAGRQRNRRIEVILSLEPQSTQVARQ